MQCVPLGTTPNQNTQILNANKELSMKYINLNHNKQTFVDDEDYEYLNQWKWSYHKDGYAIRTEYNKNGQVHIAMHRLIMKAPRNKQVDHKNGNRLDNRKENLRICNQTQNQHNRNINRNNVTGYMGVSKKQGYPYLATIRHKSKTLFIGYFKEVRHAAMAYDIWAKELRGEFAKLNFPSL